MKKHLHWLMFVVAGALFAGLFAFVDLQPKIGESFFFGSDDPAYKTAQQVKEAFPSSQQLIFSAASDNIESEAYYNQVKKLTERLAKLDGILSVKSIANGPKDLEDAIDSPLWRRLLIGKDQKSTNLIALVESDDSKALIERVEKIIDDTKSSSFEISVSGVPYIVEMIRRNLVHDFSTFSLAACGMFALVMIGIFRSVRIVIGAMLSCICAVLLTLIVQHLFGQRIGLLTANLSTIVFVLTLSHIVFMAGNWKKLGNEKDAAATARNQTFEASLWCMVTTLLGFLSLIFVDAKPLRELGYGGAIGTVAAMIMAYIMFPPFLRWIGDSDSSDKNSELSEEYATTHYWPAVVAMLLVVQALGFGIPTLNNDPSLLAYFDDGSELKKGLAHIDENGGSSPLTLVIKAPEDEKFNTSDAYEKMWALQQKFEADEAVGTVVSLPVLMAEAERSPLSFLVSWEKILSILEKPEFSEVAKSFVSEDRTQCLFLLRMKETGREEDRVVIVERLKKIVNESPYRVEMIGGIYYLQGRLSQLVSSSLVQGLSGLIGLFAIVGFLVARQLRSTIAMVISAALVPVGILGALGWLQVPLDVISAPAANVSIGMAVDAMIHLTAAARRDAKGEKMTWDHWCQARKEQGISILSSAGIVMAGFAIFGLSAFPPTQRFGIAVVFGTFIAAAAALLVLPILAAAGPKDLKAG